MEEKYICPRCRNSDPRFIGYKNGKPYCRLCLSFQGKQVRSSFEVNKNIHLSLDYPLSEKQEEVSQKVLSLLKEKKNVFIHAVTGAGKTELVYPSLYAFLKEGKHVGFATPRKDVVIDLLPRFKEAFKDARVVSVYGEHTSQLEGDIILLTTHQLYRYPNYFDLLVLDEIDAFPYKGNSLLETFFKKAVRGNYVLLSATPTKEDLDAIKKDNGEVVTLFERYHKAPLPVPVYEKTLPLADTLACLSRLLSFVKERKPVFIFVPTIEEGKKLYAFLALFVPYGAFVSSKEVERKLAIERFKKGELIYLVTTSILERGVTVKNLQVIVYHADHDIYDESTLVQIAGRVGRKMMATGGKVFFQGRERTDAICNSILSIEDYNRKAKKYE